MAQKIQLPRGNLTSDCMKFFNLIDYTHTVDINLIVWQKPRPHWLKFNADGASRGNPGKSGGEGEVFLEMSMVITFLLIINVLE